MTKVQSHVILVLHNVRMVPSNARKKKELLNVIKIQSYVMLVLSNVRKKIKEPQNVTKV